MKAIEFSYCVVRYVHDPTAGEMLNVGVVAYAPSTGECGVKWESRYHRLSEAFSAFDGEQYRRTLQRFELALSTRARPLGDDLFALEARSRVRDVRDLVATIWPDQGLSFQFGPALVGVTPSLNGALRDLFMRFVVSQSPGTRQSERRSDSEVWHAYSSALSKHKITAVLQPHKFESEGTELAFEHTYKNARWHVLQPLSFDFIDPQSITRKACTTLGRGLALKDVPEFGVMIILLGRPNLREHAKIYDAARRLLQTKLPVEHRLVEEEDAKQFAKQLERELRSHGLLPKENE